MAKDEIKEEYLQITATVREYVEEQLQLGLFESELTETEQKSQYADLDLTALEADAHSCVKCGLHQGRNTVVFGVGNPNADLMFIGEAPGADEDRKGEPFIGKAGQLLTKIIEAMQLTRNDVYIANVVKCRPPNNRDPASDEVETCSPYLLRQIELIQPKVIVPLGNFSTKLLLDTKTGISTLRGKFHEYAFAKQDSHAPVVMPTFHPAYLLRNPNAKREVWEDMQQVMTYLEQN